jgi:esterase/lipase/1-acyl-sn-glycerol-3-phosphate acyltransferase
MNDRSTSGAHWAAASLDRERRLGPRLARPSFVRYARRATGAILSAVEAVMAGRISVQGTQNLPEGPVLFVANHFTRCETFILPYLIDRYARRNVMSLAHYKLYSGILGDFLRAIGSLSTRHPEVKHRIVEDLLTGRSDWLIYPEGSMIKNKKVWKDGKFHIDAPARTGSPHTGSAVLALQVVIYKQLIALARERGDHAAVEWYLRRFHVGGELPATFSIVPINITYYPIRPGPNVLYRLARTVVKSLPRTLAEELTIEGNALFKESDITVYFGKPIDLGRYERMLRPALAGVKPGDAAAINALLEALKHRVTTKLMSEIYSRLTVNVDHLFCSALRAMRKERIAADDLDAVIYLAAREIQGRGRRRIHRTIDGSLLGLLTDQPVPALDSIRRLAVEHGVLARRGDEWHVNQVALNASHGFHDIRIKNPVGVIANELEPLREAVGTVRELANLSHHQLRGRVADLLHGEDLVEFETDYQAALASAAAGREPAPKDRAIGAPFFLRRPHAEVGIVLCHGYLAAPAEVQLLANHLHGVGFPVYGVRLKGHGTVPGQLSGVAWQDWLASFDRAYAVMKHSCRHVVLAGFSAGALLALLVAARRASAIAGAVAINPAFALVDPKSRLVPAVMRWNRALDALHVPFGRWDRIANRPEHAEINYPINHLNGVWQLEKLVPQVRKALPAVRVPTLVVQGDRDPVVRADGSRDLFARLGCEAKEWAPMAFARHGILRGEGCEVVHDRIEEWLRRLVHGLGVRHPPRMPVEPEPVPAARA